MIHIFFENFSFPLIKGLLAGLCISIFCNIFLVKNFDISVRKTAYLLTVLVYLAVGFTFGLSFSVNQTLNRISEYSFSIIEQKAEIHLANSPLITGGYKLDEVQKAGSELKTFINNIKTDSFIDAAALPFVKKQIAKTIDDKVAFFDLFADAQSLSLTSFLNGMQHIMTKRIAIGFFILRLFLILIFGVYSAYCFSTSRNNKKTECKD